MCMLCENTAKMQPSQAKERGLRRGKPAGRLDPDFQPQNDEKTRFCCLTTHSPRSHSVWVSAVQPRPSLLVDPDLVLTPSLTYTATHAY